jgi:hypothetical protein
MNIWYKREKCLEGALEKKEDEKIDIFKKWFLKEAM